MVEFRLEDQLPRINIRDDDSGDLASFVNEVLQLSLDEAIVDAEKWIDQGDIDVATSNSVDNQLKDLGNPYTVAFGEDINRRRLLVRVLVEIYKTRGTKKSITDVVRAVTGIEIIDVICPAPVTGWVLGEHLLGEVGEPDVPDPFNTDHAIFGDGTLANGRSFLVETVAVLTDEQKEIVREVIRLTKPVGSHFTGFIDATTAPTILHWELGYSHVHQVSEPLLGDEIDLQQ